jgi:hypothetical protein
MRKQIFFTFGGGKMELWKRKSVKKRKRSIHQPRAIFERSDERKLHFGSGGKSVTMNNNSEGSIPLDYFAEWELAHGR